MSSTTSQPTAAITRLSSTVTNRVLFWVILGIGAGLRLFRFPNWPLGFNQDEISAGYESWSLFYTGAQSWGERFPVYFSSGGAGQNVLYAYMNMPFMAFFGLGNPLGTRLLEVIIGIATIPLMYITVKRLHSRKVALLAMFLTAVMPWHYMLSRWGLESNILPFVMLVGAYLITIALQTKRTWVTIVALIPLALACYAYGIACVPVAAILLLLLIAQHRVIREKWGAWLIALALFLIVVAPFALFIGKQYLHFSYPFEQYLPFSLPELNRSRLADLQNTANSPLPSSLYFLFTGSNDHTAWNGLPVLGGDPFPTVFVLFALAEISWRVLATIRKRQFNIAKITIIDIWAVGSLTICFLFPVNINEINIIYLPLIILAAAFMVRLVTTIPSFIAKAVTVIILAVILAASLVPQIPTYFGKDYPAFTATNFNPGLKTALVDVRDQANGDQIYVTTGIYLNYLQTLWYLNIPPATFQRYQPTYDVPSFENFVFTKDAIKSAKTYWYLTRLEEPAPCADPQQVTTVGDNWKVGMCAAGDPVR